MTTFERLSLVAAAAAILAFAAAPVHADKETSIQLYKAGKRKYELGEYEKAIALFQQAYDEHPAPAYLYNVAQAYLKIDKCGEALEQFKKFLAEKPDAPNRVDVEAQIAELEANCVATKPEPEPVPDPPVKTEPIPEPPVAVEGTGDLGSENAVGDRDPAVVGALEPGPQRRFFAASADVGVAFFNIGDVLVPVSPSLRVAGALPLRYFGVTFEPYGAAEVQTMAYDHAGGDATVMFTTLMVGASATYPIAKKIAIGGDVGFGILHFSGLKMGNPFIAAGAEQAGAINSMAFRVGGQAEYDIGHGLAAAFSPAFVIAGGSSDLRDQISTISRIEISLGVRYRL